MSSTSSHRPAEGRVPLLLTAAALLTAGIVIFIASFLIREAAPAMRQIGFTRVLTDTGWAPTVGSYDLKPMIAATLLVTTGAVLTAAPVGVAAALFCRFFAPGRAADVLRRVLELLAGVPSVVYGFWGLTVLVPWLGQLRAPGANLAAATLILALMILPTVALTADSSLTAVPRSYLRAAAALGFSREATAWRVALPAARGGIAAGVVLATGRALGETVAVLMVAGNIARVPSSLLDPIRTLTANIALEMGYAAHLHRSALFLSGLLLLALIILLVGSAQQISRRSRT